MEKIVPDPDRESHIILYLQPAAHLNQLDEVLVITATEPQLNEQQQQDLATSEAQKTPDVNALKEQQKASQIMAERLPGLTDPNLPAPQQPPPADGTPPPPPGPTRALPALRPDRFSPGRQTAPMPVNPAAAPAASTTPRAQTPQAKTPAAGTRPARTSDGRN